MLGRCLRIIPPYVLACFVYYWATTGIVSPAELRDALLMQQGFIHLWTIPVEFKFYFVLPPLLLGCLYIQRRLGNGVMVQQWQSPSQFNKASGPTGKLQLIHPIRDGSSARCCWVIPCALLLPVSRRLIRPRIATLIGIATFLILLLSLPGTRHWLSGSPVDAELANKHLFFGLLWVAFVAALANGQVVIGPPPFPAPVLPGADQLLDLSLSLALYCGICSEMATEYRWCCTGVSCVLARWSRRLLLDWNAGRRFTQEVQPLPAKWARHTDRCRGQIPRALTGLGPLTAGPSMACCGVVKMAERYRRFSRPTAYSV